MKLHLAELSRRGVFKTLVAYAVASWVLIEVTSVLAEAFLLPAWLVAALTTALVLGALPVIMLSWRYDITWEGIKRDTSEVPVEVERSARLISSLLAMLLLAIITALWVNYFRSQASSEVERMLGAQQGAPEISADGQIRSIAVLPFDDFSPDGGRQLLADGIAEAVLHVLAKNRELIVTSRKSSFMFRDKDVSAAEIGRILNVQALLEGSIQVVNDRLRVTSQLIRTSDQAHIWSNVYEAPLADLFKVNDEIALEVRNLIFPQQQQVQGAPAWSHPPSVEAFQLLLEARDLIGDLESTEHAIRLLEVILQLWPDYADAWAWLAMAQATRADELRESHLASESEIEAVRNKMIHAADKALDLNPDNHLALLLKGEMTASYTAEHYHEAIEQVLASAPNDPAVLTWLSGLAWYTASYEHQREYLARARAVEPSSYEVLQEYLFAFCGNKPLTAILETQLDDYPASQIQGMLLRGIAQYCDHQVADSLTTLIKLARIDSNPVSALRVLLVLAALDHHGALVLIDAAHRLMPQEFNREFDGEINFAWYPEILSQRLETYRRHLGSHFASGLQTPRMYATAALMAGDYQAAAKALAGVRQMWDQFYASEDDRFWHRDTLWVYAFQAWLMVQLGEMDEAEPLAEELLAALENKGITEWSASSGRLGDIPLMILLLNGREQQAVDWLLAAEQEQWFMFQPVLTSPVYAGFREIPEVAQSLARMVAWRENILGELMAVGLPEVENPRLLLDLLESLVTPSHSDLAQVALHFDEDPGGAMQHYQQVLREEPDNVAVIGQVAELAMEFGLPDESILLQERALRLSPEEPLIHYGLSMAYAMSGRFDDAEISARAALELRPGAPWLQRWLGQVLLLSGEPQEALQVMRQIDRPDQRQMGLTLAYFALGRQAESDASLAEWKDISGIVNPFKVAYVHAFRGESDLAFKWLYDAAGVGQRVSVAASWPFLTNLHDDPRWLPFLESIGKSPDQLAEFQLNFSILE